MYNRTLFLKLGSIFAGVALATTSFISNLPEKGEKIQQIGQVDFISVAKKAVPAVVFIKVEGGKKSSVLGDNVYGLDPFDFDGNDDLWGFFNFPKKPSTKSPKIQGQATGVIIKPDGYILTNSHVVHDMDSIVVHLEDGREFNGKVLGDDPNTDLALIKIEAKDLPYLNLGNSDELEVGQWVAAVGNPFGLQASMSAGIVSAKSRNNLDIAHYEDFIQTDAAINRGNSGGPLLTLDGEVIGINTAIATNSSSGYMGIGFAIPSNMAKHVIEEILSDGKVSRGFLGITLQSIDYPLAQAFNLKKVSGALITSVVKGGPADQAGLQVEDIVLKINDKVVENSGTLRNGVYLMKPGSEARLTVLRKDKTIEIPVKIGTFTDTTIASESPKTEKGPELGLEVAPLTPDLARSLGYTDDKGVVITKLAPNSVAVSAGLKKGALIMSVNRQKVETVEMFNEAMKNHPKDRPVLLQIRQGNQYVYLSIKLD